MRRKKNLLGDWAPPALRDWEAEQKAYEESAAKICKSDSDFAFWYEIGKLFDAQVRSWTYKWSCTFRKDNGTFQIPGSAAEALLQNIKQVKK